MFGQSKAVVLSPRGKRRRGLPRWLVLLLTGTAVGVAGVLLVQEKVLPPRLSAAASVQLRNALEQTQQDRQRLEQQLAATTQRLEAALAEKETLAAELDGSRHTTEQLRKGLASLVASLPPDPRGGPVQVRAARFKTEGGQLLYDVVLSRAGAADKPLKGVLQLVVAGSPARGPETQLKLEPVALSMSAVESVRGTLALPDGFQPRLATVQVLDRPDGSPFGMRVIHVK